VNDVVDLVVLDKLQIVCSVCDIEAGVLAGEVDLLVADI
jgi:hypothetical protein